MSGDRENPVKTPDIEAFMQIGYSGSPQITQDGQRLYFISNASGVGQIYRLDQQDRWPYQLTVYSEGVDFYSLSPDGEAIICGVGSGGNENAQLWMLDARTGRTKALTNSPEVRHGNPSWTRDGSTTFFNSNEENGKDFFIYRMDLDTGKKTRIADIPGWNAAGDVSDDDRWLLVTHYDSNTNSDIYLVKSTLAEPPPARFRRGDCNDDGTVDISDAVCILEWLFLGSDTPGCIAVTNVDGNGQVDITDPIYLLTHLFLGGPAPVEPFPECGPGSPADEEIGCETPPACGAQG